jgi:hypothetical protein
MSRVQLFMKLINDQFLESSKLQELEAIWNGLEQTSCVFILTAGKRKGEECGAIDCLVHVKKQTCVYIMKLGARKGLTCDKVCKEGELCDSHKKTKRDDKKDDKKEEKKEVDEKEVESTSVKEKEVDEKEVESTSVKAEDEKKECKMILKSGSNKGKACGKKTTGTYFLMHDKKDDKKEKSEKTCQKTCKVELENGNPCGSPCEGTKTTCEKHGIIRVKKFGSHFIIKGTSVLFDMETKNAIGYIKDGTCIFEENREVREACATYHIEFQS